jgi:ABC-type multidrug transport system fused ATPase/permease subunit
MAGLIQILNRILKEGRPYIPSFAIIGTINLATIPIEFYSLLLTRNLIDNGFINRDWNIIRNVLLILLIIFLFRSLIQYGTAIFSARLQLHINRGFQNNLFSRLIYLPMRRLYGEPIGLLMSRVLEDAPKFSSILNIIFSAAIITPLKLLVLLILMVYLNIRLCSLTVITIVIMLFVIHRVGEKLRVFSKEIQKLNATIFSFVEQILANIELTKARSAETIAADGFDRLLNELINISLTALRVTLITQPLMQFLKYATLGTIFAYGSWMISRNIITIGELTIFLGSAYLFFSALSSFGSTYGSIREDLARMEALYDLLDSPSEQTDKPSLTMPSPVNAIEFKEISFGYAKDRPVLKNISFSVAKGEMLGITGQSGSGKTTLARLLLGFYQPDSGDIHINEKSISIIDLKTLRLSTGIAFQENLLLNASVRDNITYGRDDISMEQVLKAAQISNISGFVNRLPYQYDTIIGESGKSLSGGERQRMAIARSLVTDPEILILDESTSFIEIEDEKAILEAIKKLRKHRITIIISHRQSAINITDRVLVLDNGRIVTKGLRPDCTTL